jgi:hypothetical protein
MINLLFILNKKYDDRKICKDCKNIAKYNFKDELYALYCKNHFKEHMIKIKYNRLINNNGKIELNYWENNNY